MTVGHDEERRGVGFWLGAAVGAAVVAFGVHGLLENEPRGAASAIRWLVGGAAVADLAVVPIGAASAWILHRLTPTWAWPIVRGALLASVTLAMFALPLLLGWGGTPGNPTVRPRDPQTGLALSLGAVWAVAGIALLVRARTRPLADPAAT